MKTTAIVCLVLFVINSLVVAQDGTAGDSVPSNIPPIDIKASGGGDSTDTSNSPSGRRTTTIRLPEVTTKSPDLMNMTLGVGLS